MATTTKAKVTMTCPTCDIRCASFGTHRNGLRRFHCAQCKTTYTEPHAEALGGMTLADDKKIMVLKLLFVWRQLDLRANDN